MTGNVIAVNKKAAFEYYIEEKFEAGIILVGCEVIAARRQRQFGGQFLLFRKLRAGFKKLLYSAVQTGVVQ